MEYQIEQKLRRAIKRIDGLALKLTSPSMAGIPDRLVLMSEGRIYFVELKAPGKVPTPRQLKVHEVLRKLGFEVRVIDGFEVLNEFINEVSDK